MKKLQITAIAILCFAANAYAQEWEDVTFSDPSGTGERITSETGASTEFGGQAVDTSNTYLYTSQYDPTQPGNTGGGTMIKNGFIDINSFATALSVSANAASIQSNQAAIQMAQFSILELQRAVEVNYQGTALSSALVTTMPRPGDRFSFNANIAEFENELGVGLSFGYSPNEKFMIHIGHARSDDTYLTRGGISLSW